MVLLDSRKDENKNFTFLPSAPPVPAAADERARLAEAQGFEKASGEADLLRITRMCPCADSWRSMASRAARQSQLRENSSARSVLALHLLRNCS